jgi:hypothetical protein
MARRFLSAIKLLTGTTPPTGTAGDTFFDTDTKTIQVHDGTDWVNSTVRATDGAIGGRVFTGDTTPTSPVAGDLWVDSSGFSAGANILRWRETAAGGETSLSGLDDLGTTLSYTPGYELVHLNGVLQVRGVDYVATTGTTITGLAALVADDVVDVIAHQNMVYGDYYTQSQADSRFALQTNFPDGVWQSWSPTLEGGWLNGNGTWDAKYVQIGKTVHAYGKFTVGSTTTKGTDMRISIPVTAANSLQVFPAYSVVGATQYSLSIRLESTTQLRVITHDVVSYVRSVQITAAVPATWATGNILAFQITYEAA